MPVVTNTTTPTVAEHIKWRRPRNQFSHHHHHHPILESDPNPQIPSIIQSARGKSTISSLLLSTFSNNTSSSSNDTPTINGTAQSKKKSNFSAATLRGLGCTAGASQQVSVPAVIRSSADWQGKKTRKKKHKRATSGGKNKTFHGGILEGSNPGCVDFQDVWCGPGIGFSADTAASVDCVVARKNVSARGKIDVDKITHRERSSYAGRRTETFTFLDTDSDIFTPRSASDSYGTATYYRHVRDPSSDGFAEIMMLQGSLLMGGQLNSHDQFRDWRLDVDNMSYEQLLELGERIGHVNTGLKEDEMGRNIRKARLQIWDDTSKHQIDKECSICQEEYEAGDELGRLNCEHSYHFQCIKQWLSQKNFCPVYFAEIEHLTELMRSRTVGSSVGEERKNTEVIPSDPVLPHAQREEYLKTPALENVMDLVSTPYVAKVSVDDVASPAELAKAYMGSRSSKLSPSMLGIRSSPREDPTLLRSQNFSQKSPIMSIVPRATTLTRVHENGFVTPRSRGRSAIYNMARTPYSRVHPGSVPKGARVDVEGEPSSSAHHVIDHHMLSGSKQGLLKRRSSVLDNDIGSFGPIRRIRHKSNLLSSNRLSLSHLGNPISIDRSGVGTDAAQQPSSSTQKPNLLGEARHTHSKLSAETVDDTMPSTSTPPLPSKSSEMATKILQQLDKLVSPKEKSPTKLSSSMLRGQALRSIETVDSSKFLDNILDKQLDDTLKNMSSGAPRLKSKIDETENGSSKLVAPTDAVIPVDANATVPRKQDISILKSGDSSGKKTGYYPPQKKRAFHMSAPEDYLELDDEANPNGAVSPFSTSRKETTVSTALADKTASSIETAVLEKSPVSSVLVPSKFFTIDGKPQVRTADGSIVEEKVDVSTFITPSVSDPMFKPTTGAITTASNTSLGSNKSTPNGSVANSPLFNFGNNGVPSTERTAGVASSKDTTKPSPLFGLEKVASPKEPGTEAPLVNSGFNKIVDKVPHVPFTFSSSGGESTVFKFGSSDSNPRSLISSSPVAGAVDAMPKLDLENAGAKSNIFTGFSTQSSEPAVSSALTPSSTNIFTFGNNSNLNIGPAASNTSPLSSVFTNNFADPNIFSSSSLATSNSSSSATVTSTSPCTTTSTPAVVAVTNSSSSSQVASLSPTTSVFKFGSTPLQSTSLPVSSSASEPLETKNSIFGSSSAAVGSTGSGIIGFNSSVATTGSSQSLGSVIDTTSGSVPATLASSGTSLFATSSESQPVAFSSSASAPLFGLSGSTGFASGSSLFASSSSPTNIFNAGTTSGQSTPAASSEANPVSSSSGPSSTVFGLSSWQPNKSPFGSSFSSTSSPSSGFAFGSSFSSSSSSTPGFSFGSSTSTVTSTSSPMMFGSSAVASTPQFSFTSATATTNTQPAFGSSSPVFSFGSAPVNNDQMNMEDSMAEDTVQATPPATPLFGQQPAPLQSNFAFGAPTPTGATPFQFGGQQSIAPQNPSPFQASGSLEFNAGGSFSLGTGGGDKSGRKFVKVKHRQRKK